MASVAVGDRVVWTTGNALATAEWIGVVQRVDPPATGGYAYIAVDGFDSLAIVPAAKLHVVPSR